VNPLELSHTHCPLFGPLVAQVVLAGHPRQVAPLAPHDVGDSIA
jgi:hypothetical protein